MHAEAAHATRYYIYKYNYILSGWTDMCLYIGLGSKWKSLANSNLLWYLRSIPKVNLMLITTITINVVAVIIRNKITENKKENYIWCTLWWTWIIKNWNVLTHNCCVGSTWSQSPTSSQPLCTRVKYTKSRNSYEFLKGIHLHETLLLTYVLSRDSLRTLLSSSLAHSLFIYIFYFLSFYFGKFKRKKIQFKIIIMLVA